MDLFKKHFKEDMSKNINDAMKIWLRAVTGKVPILTGMAQASLYDLADTIGMNLLIIPKTKKSRLAEGRALGSAQAKYGPNVYSMVVKSKVPHYVMQEHDNIGASRSAPWESFEAGNTAVLNFKPKLRKLPIAVRRINL